MTVSTVIVPSVTRQETIRTQVSLSEFKPEEVAEWLRGEGYQVDGTFRKVLAPTPLVTDIRHKPWCSRSHDSCECGGSEEVEGLMIEQDQLSRAETLILCGQREAAREMILALVSEGIGRTL